MGLQYIFPATFIQAYNILLLSKLTNTFLTPEKMYINII